MEPWSEIVSGLWLGNARYMPTRDRFDAVLTLVAHARAVEDGVRHRIWVMPTDFDDATFADHCRWVAEHWLAGRTVLVRSLHGQHRGALVVQRVLADIGATPEEARALVAARRPHQLETA